MSIKRVIFGASLTKNKDGSAKPECGFWGPPRNSLSVPKGNTLHNRPMAFLETNLESHIGFVFYDDRVEAVCGGYTKTIVKTEELIALFEGE